MDSCARIQQLSQLRPSAVFRREKGDQWSALAPIPWFWTPDVQQPSEPCLEERKNISVALLNIERGQKLDLLKLYCQSHPVLTSVDILFANELDDHLPRSGMQDVTVALAESLQMGYVRAVEFWELAGEQNGLHDNAIFTRFPILDAGLLRLPVYYDWYGDEQKRLGTRLALWAKLSLSGQEALVVCLHLENVSSPVERAESLALVLQEIRRMGLEGLPLILAGDLNTNTIDGHASEPFLPLYQPEESQRRLGEIFEREPLFAVAEAFQLDYRSSNVPDKVTRRRHHAGQPEIPLNLDWILTRGISAHHPGMMETRFQPSELKHCPPEWKNRAGEELSDHNAVFCSVDWPPRCRQRMQ